MGNSSLGHRDPQRIKHFGPIDSSYVFRGRAAPGDHPGCPCSYLRAQHYFRLWEALASLLADRYWLGWIESESLFLTTIPHLSPKGLAPIVPVGQWCRRSTAFLQWQWRLLLAPQLPDPEWGRFCIPLILVVAFVLSRLDNPILARRAQVDLPAPCPLHHPR